MALSRELEAGSADQQQDAELIRRAGGGDDRAWTVLMQRYQEPAFRLAYLILRDADDAEDVAQEAFIRAYRKLAQYDRERPFRPWLLAIVANLARNRRRSLGRYWQMVQRVMARQPTPAAVNPLEERAEARLLWQAVQKLSPLAQEIIYLRYFLELSEAETAEALDIPPGTAKSRLSRALRQLRGVVEQDYPELGDVSI